MGWATRTRRVDEVARRLLESVRPSVTMPNSARFSVQQRKMAARIRLTAEAMSGTYPGAFAQAVREETKWRP